MKDLINDIVSKIQLDKNSINIENKDGRFWIIEGESELGDVEERYLVYDCADNDHQFEFEKYKSYMDEEEGIAYPIMVFRNWEHEWVTRRNIFNELGNAEDRKKLLQYFEKKTSIYTELSDAITLNIEERGINYLQYDIELENAVQDEKGMLKGRIYNVTFGELKKLFNITGKDLFRKNVRSGLKNNGTGNGIRRKFKEYIRIGAYYEWIKNHPSDKDVEEIKCLFEIEEDSDVRIPEAFWFYHNGITIFYFGEENIDFSGAQIKLNPKKVSVINGAQTMTNYYEGIKEIDLEFKNDVLNLGEQEKINDIKSFFEKYLATIDYKIKVKTIFIDGDEKYVQPITYGLNTQIPIIEPDIIADSVDVEEINKCLKSGKLKILKGGEVASIGSGFSVLDFVKKYLIINNQPGRSKNLRRGDIEGYIKKAKSDFEENSAELIKALQNLEIIEEWWKNSKKNRELTYTDEKEKIYNNHGKNYFESFVLKERRGELEEEYLELLFDKYINVFTKLEPNPEVKCFKNDGLFDSYLKLKDEQQNILLISEGECIQLRNYLNDSEISHYSIQKKIVEYLKSIQKDMPYFRVISRTNGKVREAFPFASITFSELYQGEIGKNGEPQEIKKYKKYEDSCLKREIEKTIPVFVIDWKISQESGNGRIAQEVKYIPEFSFEKYKNEAKEVYDLTVKAFENGDEEAFPKMSDKKCFHVRPKAINADDTFEFSNGNQITKRTFWANKDTVDSLLNQQLEKKM